MAYFAPAVSYAVYEAAKGGDFGKAFEALKKASLLDRFMGKAGSRRASVSVFPEWMRMPSVGLSIIKYGMNLVGLRGGEYHAGQLPTEGLTDEEKREFKETFQEMGVL